MNANHERMFRPGDQLVIMTPAGRVAMIYSDVVTGLPPEIINRCERAKVILRLAGSTSEVDSMARERLTTHVREAFSGIRMRPAVTMNGAARVVFGSAAATDTLELPRMIAMLQPGRSISLGTAPRTSQTMSLDRRAQFVALSDPGPSSATDISIDAVWFTHADANAVRWNGDVKPQFDLMDTLRRKGVTTGLWVWGGKLVTVHEVVEALTRQHPVAVVDGSGNLANALCDLKLGRTLMHDTSYHEEVREHILRPGLDLSRATIMQSPQDTRKWLIATGMATAA